MKFIRLCTSIAVFVALFTLITLASVAQSVTISHELGTTVIPQTPEKVVVFDFGVLESLDRLGVPVTALPKASSLPPHLAKFADSAYGNVGSLVEPDFEAIAEIAPDLIIISGRQSAHYDELSKLAPTVYMGLNTSNYLESFKANMRNLGKIFAKTDTVEKELATIQSSIDEVRELARGKRTLVTLVTGGKANAYGPGSRYGFVYDVLGLEPVDSSNISSTHGQNISFEYILVRNPDYILVIDRDAVVSGGGSQTAKQVMENALVKETKAYRNGRIAYLDPYTWYISGGGLISFTQMIDDIKAIVQ